MKLQQIASGFAYTENNDVIVTCPMDKLPKFIDLKEQLENEVTGKAIIICVHNYTIDALLQELGPDKVAVIRGGMDTTEVLEEKRRFNEDPDCRWMVGQIKAIKYGHTLMGDKDNPCLDLFYFENSYSLDDRAQSEERPQGAGQLGPLHVVDYATCEIERKITAALQRKEGLAEIIRQHYLAA